MGFRDSILTLKNAFHKKCQDAICIQRSDQCVDKLPFIDYSIYNWGNHCRKQIDNDVEVMAIDILRRMERVGGNNSPIGNLICWPCKQIDCVYKYPSSALHIAAYFGLYRISESLLKEHNYDANSTIGHRGMAPLSVAARAGHCQILKLLLRQADIKFNLGDKMKWSPLAFAAYYNQVGSVRTLLYTAEDVDVNLFDGNDTVPLLFATVHGNADIVRMLLERPDIEVNISYTRTELFSPPLINAINERHPHIVHLLLARRGIDVNIQDGIGRTPLINAINMEDLNTVRALFNRTDINVDSRSLYSDTALLSAIDKQNPRIVESLLERNPDLNMGNHSGTTPFSIAKRKFDELSEDLQRIFQRGYQPDLDNADIVRFSKSGRVLQILQKLSVGKSVLRCKKVM